MSAWDQHTAAGAYARRLSPPRTSNTCESLFLNSSWYGVNNLVTDGVNLRTTRRVFIMHIHMLSLAWSFIAAGLDPDTALVEEHVRLLANATFREPNGTLRYPYLVPAGPYDEMWGEPPGVGPGTSAPPCRLPVNKGLTTRRVQPHCTQIGTRSSWASL